MVNSNKSNNLKEKLMQYVFYTSALVSVLAVVSICLFLLMRGIPAIAEIGFKNFIFGQKWAPVDTPPSFGILSMIVGSLYVTAGAIVIGVPIGIMCAVFLAEFCPAHLYKFVKPSVNLLAGIPSIIYGFFGMQIVVPFVRESFGGNGYSILSASVILGIMILPTIISISESSIRAVPETYKEGSLGIGATKEETVFKVVLPAASSGILTSIILGIGRAVGETMAVVMVAGGSVMPLDKIALLKPIRTLTANIVTEMSYSSGLHTESLIATGVVLFVFIIILNATLSLIKSSNN
ncbi:phosphate transport system permease protein [Sedimentibacter acidaminivorans]|uniref:Phosphate transport system permease protein n=1 Tax=Sedimentibacter acidaminivorans TaxID=913099 RepID=A0ABS4GA71_9FIRM|nr:phosphate ABC transporter permease subunit PstC [Sedimentibacter acidaminivorans]MBP1924564.1 phosphate transport system permease protein [Sedimentibacter acidaminivorans]